MKLVAILQSEPTKRGYAFDEQFIFTEHNGMCNVTYLKAGSEAEPICFRFNSRAQGNAAYLALKRLGATGCKSVSECVSLKLARWGMELGVRKFDELLGRLMLQGLAS